MTDRAPFLAFSYHFATDYPLVQMLANELAGRGVPAWYLGRMSRPDQVSNLQYLGGDFDWRLEPQNWHAAYLDRLCRAAGIIVVLSDEAEQSRDTVGRGMWRERPAVDFFRADNPLRTREISLGAGFDAAAIADELAAWGRSVLALPPVLRREVGDPNAGNRPTGMRGPIQLPEVKSAATDWFELVRRDLYDVQWHCRRCGLQSDPYVMSQEDPPERCSRCGFERDSAHGVLPVAPPRPPGLSEEDERRFVGRVSELLERIQAGMARRDG